MDVTDGMARFGAPTCRVRILVSGHQCEAGSTQRGRHYIVLLRHPVSETCTINAKDQEPTLNPKPTLSPKPWFSYTSHPISPLTPFSLSAKRKVMRSSKSFWIQAATHLTLSAP